MVGDCEIGEINSIRYRSYYYDNETNLYYCNSRYYDARLCRWINSDESIFVLLASNSILGCNIYSYCESNPVNNIDPDGNLRLSSTMSILIGFAGIIMVTKSILGGVKGFFKLTDKNKLATILCSAIMILPMTAAVQMLLYYVENWISVFVAAIVAINTAIMVGSAFTGGLAKIITGVGEFVLGCYLPNIITSVNMIINGFKGHSYDMKIGFLTSKYKLV